ncbi:MAG: helix-turn-helix domain-containing protein [Defluviitaleaceae bacterium]|nr:helix-turn-helix domain-containing protein [Defluviitaleaceae bacterium]
MGNKTFFNRKSVIFKVAAAFLILVIIPFSIGLVLLNISYEEQIRSRWLSENETRLIAMQDEVTNIHLDLNSMLVQIRLDDAFSPHRIGRNSYHLMLAMMQLRRYHATNNALHTLAYVERFHGFILSNTSSDDRGNFASRFFSADDMQQSLLWYSIDTSNNDAFAEPLMVISSATTRGNILVYAANMRDTRILDTPVLLVLLDALAIETQLSGSLPMESAGLLITNRDGKVLLSTGNVPAYVTSHGLSEWKSNENHHDYLLSYSIAANGWSYYMFLPVTDLLQEVRGATRLYAFFGLAFAGASILFFALSYKFNFLPLRRFVRLVRQNNHDEMKPLPKGSEYELIYAGYQALVKKTDSIQRQLDESYPIRRSSLLHRLIFGGINEKEGLEESQALALNLEGKRFFTVVLLFSADGEDFAHARIQESIQEYMDENKLGYLVTNVLDDALTLLLCLPFPEQEAHKLEVVRLQAVLNIHTMACAGGIYSRLGDIRLSFQEAVRTSRYRSIANKNTCITFSETGEDSAFSRIYPTKVVQSFYQALHSEDSDAVLAHIQEVRCLMDGFTITLCRCIYCDLAFGIFHYFQNQSPVPPLNAELLDGITQALETQEMREMLMLMGHLESSFLDIIGEKVNVKLVDRVRQYIDNHFHESSLSILEIADALRVSTGHLSRSYKKDAGETLLNYINNKRIEKAKTLLSDTDMPLHEVVQEIGYLDVSSFHRKFKSTVGLTPGAYRDKTS